MSDPSASFPPPIAINKPNQFQKDFFQGVQTAIVDTAANLALANPVLIKGQIGYETDTLSFKVGDGTTAYNSLTYFYRGLVVAGQPSLGTLKHFLSGDSGSKAILSGVAAPSPGNWYGATSVASLVPAGTKAILANIGSTVTGTAAALTRLQFAFPADRTTVPTYTMGFPMACLADWYCPGAGSYNFIDKEITIPLTSDLKFDIYNITAANVTSSPLYVVLKGYYI
jgi:hypothetical protein